MSISQAEVIVDRRQLKRRLFRWRILAILAVLLALGALFWSGGDFKKQFDHIARIHIDGLITGDEATLKLLDDLAKYNRVKGVIVRIDSPGGTTAGSEAIYEKITDTRNLLARVDFADSEPGDQHDKRQLSHTL